jgi:hypothetical protein
MKTIVSLSQGNEFSHRMDLKHVWGPEHRVHHQASDRRAGFLGVVVVTAEADVILWGWSSRCTCQGYGGQPCWRRPLLSSGFPSLHWTGFVHSHVCLTHEIRAFFPASLLYVPVSSSIPSTEWALAKSSWINDKWMNILNCTVVLSLSLKFKC